MNPSHDGGVVHGAHAYVKRADGSMGYEAVPDVEPLPEPLSAKKEVTPIAVVKVASK